MVNPVLNKNKFQFIVLFSIVFLTTAHAQWSKGYVPHGRTANSVAVIGQTDALMVGGNEYNDSIQSIFKTGNGATSWSSVKDVVKPWLRAVSFGNTSTGYVAGYDGTVLKTTDGGNSWSALTLPGNVAGRQFNAVYFVSSTTGYIAGGYKSDDSIQTILKTSDGGSNWTLQRDNLGYWLNAICFTDASNGIAVGDHGVVLRTTNGGSNWTPVALTGNLVDRNFNAVTFLNTNTGFIAGGNRSNDSIQTILKTIDGGSNWSIVKDNIAPMLNGIDFATASIGYAVGDYGALLETTDAGNNWNEVLLPDSINDDTSAFYCVNFINADFGLAGGKKGKLLKYISPVQRVPAAITQAANLVSSSGAHLNGLVNPNNTLTGVRFEYGATTSLGNVLAVVPDSVNGNATVQVSAALTGLIPNTFYYYRIVAGNTYGENSGQILQFYTIDCEIPNCSFENWDTAIYIKPKGWNFMGTVVKATSYNGSIAAQLSGPGSTTGGVILLGVGDDNGIHGGISCNAQPDSISFYAKYDIVSGDTAFVAMFFKKNGTPINDVRIPITGTSNGNFERLSYPISFPNSTVPDTVVIGFVSSNIFSNGASGNPQSILTVDDVSFIGGNITIPNAGFEEWDTLVLGTISGWGSSSYNNILAGYNEIEKTTDAVAGYYALKMNNYQKAADLVSGLELTNWNVPTFSVSGRHATLNMFLKYLPVAHDSLNINLTMFLHDTAIGVVNISIDTAIVSYTPISFNINYYVSPLLIPDSATLTFSMRRSKGTGSYVYIDKLTFDGFGTTEVKEPAIPFAEGDEPFALYPNPSFSIVNVRLSKAEKSRLDIYDYTGNQVYSCALTTAVTAVDVSRFAEGIYLVKVSGAHKLSTRKLVIAK